MKRVKITEINPVAAPEKRFSMGEGPKPQVNNFTATMPIKAINRTEEGQFYILIQPTDDFITLFNKYQDRENLEKYNENITHFKLEGEAEEADGLVFPDLNITESEWKVDISEWIEEYEDRYGKIKEPKERKPGGRKKKSE
jgi:hypothetical protein